MADPVGRGGFWWCGLRLLYGMLVFAILAVFVAGLMIGRTPEYLGKKIGAFEIKMASIAILAAPLVALFGAALSVALQAGRAAIANPGAHGFTEILYAFSSAANNNGSAFAGLQADTPLLQPGAGADHALGPLRRHGGSAGAGRRAGR